jgi:hypothetical protein
LMLKYGRATLVDELSGTLGQVGPRLEADLTDPSATPQDGTAGRPPSATNPEPSRAARRRAGRRAASRAALVSPVTSSQR